MIIYNLLKCSWNYSDKTGSLWFCSKAKTTNFNNDVVNTNAFKLFKYKIKLLGNKVRQPAPNNNTNDLIAAPLKNLSNFWRLLDIPLINCKVQLKLKWTKHFVYVCLIIFADSNNFI